MSKLKKDSDKIEIINTLSKCIKIYDENLKNKKVMFIVENKKRKLEIEEMFFGKRNFYHLTGVKVLDKTGKELSSNNFYDLLLKSRINYSKLVKKDNTTSTDKRINSKISDFINVNSKILLSNKAENRLFSASQKN